MCENLCISSRSIKNSLGIFRTHVVGQANVLVNPLVVNSFSFCVYSFIPHQLALVEIPSNLATMYCTMEPSPRSPPQDDDDDEAEEDEGDSTLSIGVSASA